tara:strand:+ start:544 stop:1857 length:1314 start_codon:yes stop_codon:yes gene_type:complete
MLKTKKNLNISIAGLGNVGSSVVLSLTKNHQLILDKTNTNFNISGISAKNKSKERIFDINQFKWFDNPFDLLNSDNCDILIELIGEEKGISFDLVKKALESKIHVVTANKALLSKNGDTLFKIAEENKVQLLFEAAVCGGIPIINILKSSIFFNKINKISGIFNGTTNYILSEMENKNLNFMEVLKEAKKNGYAESDSTNDIEGIDSAHKLSLLSTLCFGSKISFDNISYKGISQIDIEDIKNANKLGYKIKLISESELVDNKLISVVEPKLLFNTTRLANVNGVLNAVKIETNHLKNLIFEGEGAGGTPTASSIISDLCQISNNISLPSLGFQINELKNYDKFDISEKLSSYYLRIIAEDSPGVLAKITSNLTEENISVKTILQIPDKKNNNNQIPIIIITHDTKKTLLTKVLKKIEKLDFVHSKITVITIDKNID